jgi:hypothetical protein
MTIDQPPADTEWIIEQSHRMNHPRTINSDSLEELRSRVQVMANWVPDHARYTNPCGPLEFRYECDHQNLVTVVHAYFVGHNGLRKRFMKLRRN